MGDILKDYSRKSLINAIESNLFELYRNYSRSPNAELQEKADIIWLITGLQFPLFNSIARAKFAKDNMRDRVEETIAHYALRRVPVMWWVGPSTQPSNLGDILEAYKFKHEVDLTCMAVTLNTLNEKQRRPANLKIVNVKDIHTLRLWCETVSSGFAMPEGMEKLLFEFEYGLGLESHLPWQRYLAILDGVPASATAMMLGAGVAGIYWTSTSPGLRLQGLGTAVVLEALQEARKNGYQISVLHSTPVGTSMYRRLGFKQYCTVSRYIRQE